MRQISRLAEELLPSQEGLCSMELFRSQFLIQNNRCTCVSYHPALYYWSESKVSISQLQFMSRH